MAAPIISWQGLTKKIEALLYSRKQELFIVLEDLYQDGAPPEERRYDLYAFLIDGLMKGSYLSQDINNEVYYLHGIIADFKRFKPDGYEKHIDVLASVFLDINDIIETYIADCQKAKVEVDEYIGSMQHWMKELPNEIKQEMANIVEIREQRKI